jgi:CSLREA domain-containing protein
MNHRATHHSRIRTILAVLALTGLLPGVTGAAVITVTDFVDDSDTANGTCTLREAIRSANANVSVDACTAGSAVAIDSIYVLPGTHVVDLSSGNDEDNAVTGDLDILDQVEIRGSSAAFSIIDGSGGGATDRLFHVHPSAADVIFWNVALRGGNAADTSQLGGVLWNESGASPVQLIGVELSGGTAAVGGGIVNEGNLSIYHSRITGNQTTVNLGTIGNDGGGIASAGMAAELHISDSEISGNQAEEDGAGLWVGSGSFTLHRSKVAGNVGGGDGGGLFVATTPYEVDYVEFSNNVAGQGGGVYMAGSGEVQHSAFVQNEAASAGGAVHDTAGGFVRFSTLSDNTAPTGAGVYSDSGQTLLDSDTIAQNVGDGVFNQSGVFFENALLAQNSGANCSGSAPAFGAFNLEDTNTCGFVSGVGTPNFPNTNPMIGPLQDNGGPTPTMALLPGSPAIDVVTSEIRMNCQQMLDQRGYPRGRPRTDIGGNDVFLCDIGAYEATTPFVVDDLTDAVDDDPADDLCQTAGLTCTLRAAVQQANNIPGMNEIELGAGTHLLSIAGSGEDNAATGDLDLDTPVSIRGAGTAFTIVDGGGLDRVFDVGVPDHTATNAPGLTRIEDLSITGGDAGLDNGGAIASVRDLRAERVFLFGNNARRGSAISSVRTGYFFPTEPFQVELVDSTVTFNSGALPLFLADARITGSSVVDNTATISTNGGAGEFLDLYLKNSTVSGNHASGTGAFFANRAIIDSSTIYDNSADFSPGGVFLLELSVFHDSIIAGNLAGGSPDECSFSPNAITSFGYNLTDTAAGDCNLTDPTDQDLTDPILETLAYNGGPTLTHLPGTGSPAIDAGDPFVCPALDQRGFPRPGDGDMNGSFVCDVGAVELPEPGFVAGLMAGGSTVVGMARRRGQRETARR